MQLLVRFDSLVAIYTDYNKLCKMESDWLKSKGSTTHWNSRPGTEKRQHHIEWQVLHSYCRWLLHFLRWWAFWKYSGNERHIFHVSDMTEKRHTVHHRRWESEYQMLSTGHSESKSKGSQQKRCLILMAKAKQKKDSKKLVIFNHYTSFQSPDSRIIRKEKKDEFTVSWFPVRLN